MDRKKVVPGFVPCCLFLALCVSAEVIEGGHLNIVQSSASTYKPSRDSPELSEVLRISTDVKSGSQWLLSLLQFSC